MRSSVSVSIACLLVLLTSLYIIAQEITWQRTYDFGSEEAAYTAIQTIDGDYLLIGYSPPGTLVIKVDSYGDTIWSRIFPGYGFDNIIQTFDSNFVMVGQVSNNNVDSPNGYILKFNEAGQVLWSKLYGGPSTSALNDLIELSDKSLVIVGTKQFQVASPFLFSMYVLKTNENGEEIWSRTFDSTGKSSTIEHVEASGFLISGNTSLYTDYEANIIHKSTGLGTGRVINNSDFLFAKNEGNGFSQIRITKTDTAFNIKWSKLIKNSNLDLICDSFIRTQNKNKYFIGGEQINPFTGDINSYLVSIDTSAKILWNANLFPRPNFNETINYVTNCKDSGFLAVGINSPFIGNEDFYAIKTDKNGNTTPVAIKSVSSVEADQFTLYQNYPNPFNSFTIITFSLKNKSSVRLTLYNLLGQKIRELLNSSLIPGEHTINVNGEAMASGIYFYELMVNDANLKETKKLLLLK